MTATPHKDQIIAALKGVAGPGGESDIVSLGLVSEIVLQDGKVIFSIAVPPHRARELEPLRARAERAAATVPDVSSVVATLTADRAPGRPSSDDKSSMDAVPSGPAPLHGIRNVTHIVAVASGKGGVGKSTTAVNLALALRGLGLRTGLLDADIYGPSIPRLMGLRGKPDLIDDRMLKPMERHGVKTMSIGFLVDEETPMIWRGPMVISALTQMMRDVDWGELDIMIVDMPPGTGDAQLTMAQQVPLSGAVIVSTPQDLALIDARKGLNMFRRVNVPLAGLVENMSYFLCPGCGTRSEIFGHGGGRTEADRLGVPFLGEIPLDMVIRESSDGGDPIVVSHPDSPHTKVYSDVASRLWKGLSGAEGKRAGPSIMVE